jgi:hypothetical protein
MIFLFVVLSDVELVLETRLNIKPSINVILKQTYILNQWTRYFKVFKI